MNDRLFTPQEANDALAEVRPVAERLVVLRERIRELAREQGRSVTAIGGNGAGYAATDLHQAKDELAKLSAEASDCLERLAGLGVVVKEPDLGLLDFPAVREGEHVLLCWHAGENAVTHWHRLEEGYAGRKPVDWGE